MLRIMTYTLTVDFKRFPGLKLRGFAQGWQIVMTSVWGSKACHKPSVIHSLKQKSFKKNKLKIKIGEKNMQSIKLDETADCA